jgi:hypothetical protein
MMYGAKSRLDLSIEIMPSLSQPHSATSYNSVGFLLSRCMAQVSSFSSFHILCNNAPVFDIIHQIPPTQCARMQGYAAGYFERYLERHWRCGMCTSRKALFRLQMGGQYSEAKGGLQNKHNAGFSHYTKKQNAIG